MTPSWWNQTITVKRAPLGPDAYGTPDAERDWASAATHTIARCLVVPGGTSESRDGREAVATLPRLFGPAGADLEAGDRVTWNGHEYDLEGDPAHWPSATGALDHIEASLKRVTG